MATLQQAILDIDYNGGGTHTASAIKYALENKFKPETGYRNRVPHITMVITDGETADSHMLQSSL